MHNDHDITCIAPIFCTDHQSKTWALLSDYRNLANNTVNDENLDEYKKSKYNRSFFDLNSFYDGIYALYRPHILSPYYGIFSRRNHITPAYYTSMRSLFPHFSFSDTNTLATMALVNERINKFPFHAYVIGRNIIDREQNNPKYVYVYHAISRSMYALLCINTYLDHIIHGTKLDSNFIKLRTNRDLYDDTNGVSLTEYCNRDDIHDGASKDGPHLLSISLAFPSVVNDGESAIGFFLHNNNELKPERILDRILSSYQLDIYTKSRLRHIFTQIQDAPDRNRLGSVIQIGIPREHVNRCVYISLPFGIPHSLQGENGRNLSTYDVLNLHQRDICQLEAYASQRTNAFIHVSNLQARIRLDYTLFAQPGPITMHIHNGFSQNTLNDLYDHVYAAVYPSDITSKICQSICTPYFIIRSAIAYFIVRSAIEGMSLYN